MTKQGVKGSVCRSNSYPLRPRRVTWIQTKREGVYKLRRSQTGHAQSGLSCKAPKCSDTGTGALGVLITHETSLMQATITRTTHLATASPGSDALAPPGSVGQASNRQAEPLLRRPGLTTAQTPTAPTICNTDSTRVRPQHYFAR